MKCFLLSTSSLSKSKEQTNTGLEGLALASLAHLSANLSYSSEGGGGVESSAAQLTGRGDKGERENKMIRGKMEGKKKRRKEALGRREKGLVVG